MAPCATRYWKRSEPTRVERAVAAGEWVELEERRVVAPGFGGEDRARASEGPLKGAGWIASRRSTITCARPSIRLWVGTWRRKHSGCVAIPLWRFWWVRGNWKEGRDRLETALALQVHAVEDHDSRQRTPRGRGLGKGAGDFDAAQALLGELGDCARAIRPRGDRLRPLRVGKPCKRAHASRRSP